MHEIKIKNYERIYGAGKFMQFRHLSESEGQQILQELRRKFHRPDNFDTVALLELLRSKSIVAGNIGTQHFDLRDIFNKFDLNVPEVVYLNWYRFDDMDEVKTEDLVRDLEHVWYPSSDDLEIIEPHLNWVISIEHFGTVLLYQ